MASERQPFLRRLVLPERRAWRGERRLAPVFWGYGVGVSLALIILHATALLRGQILLQQILIAVSAAYTGWILVAIWRCAANAAPLWGMFARWLTIAWALNAAMVLLFLEIELLLRIAGR